MQKLIITTVFLTIYFTQLIGQNNPSTKDSLIVWISSEPSGSDVAIIGHVKNLSKKSLELNYELMIAQKGINFSRNKQRDKFTLDSLGETTLGNVSLNVQSHVSYQVVLKIYEDTLLLKKKNFIYEPEPQEIGTSLIIDESKSKKGHDFYDLFYKNWGTHETNTDAIITIDEKPVRSRTSLILIKVNDQLVMQQILNMRYDQIEEQAKLGVDATIGFLKNFEDLKKQFESEDSKGTGLF